MSERTDLTAAAGVAEHLDEIQLVDCRELYEWAAGRIEGAVHIPLNSIMAGVTGELDPEKPVVVVCRSGNRSELACSVPADSRRTTSRAGWRTGRPRASRSRRPRARPAAWPSRQASGSVAPVEREVPRIAPP
jgi:hypothetical protein